MPSSQAIKIGISSCLLGEHVRYDGRSKYAAYLVEALGNYADFVPVCPEMAIGLGVPRPPLGLIGMNSHVAAVGIYNPAIDVTEDLVEFGKQQAALLGMVSGYIFKSRSPSCGLDDTPIRIAGEEIHGSGLYARQIIEAMPSLPVADEIKLKLEKHANRYLEQVFAYRRWQRFLDRPLSAARLGFFHSLHIAELQGHDADAAVRLADFVRSIKDPVSEETAASYLHRFMTALQKPAVMDLPAEKLFETHERIMSALDDHTG